MPKRFQCSLPPAAPALRRAWLLGTVIGLAMSWEALEAQNVEFRQSSSPAGVINQVSFPQLGSRTSTVTAPLNPSGYRFTHWTLNGSRISHATGRASNPVIFTINDPMDAVARYLPEGQDSDGDGLLDWMEVHHLGSLSTGANDDPDGDGIPTRIEVERGYDPAARDALASGGASRRRTAMVTLEIADPGVLDTDRDGFIRRIEDFRGYRDDVYDRLEAGGSSRRRSVPVLAVLSSNHARLHESSSPAGVFSQERIVTKGTTVSLFNAPLTSNGYRYTGWFVDGIRVDRPPLNQPVPLVVNTDTRAVARYILEAADTDADGIPDWQEWYLFESLGNTLASDPDSDGIIWDVEQFRGYSTFAKDALAAGGVSRRRSQVIDVDTSGRIPWRMTSLPGGMVNQQGLAVPGSTVTTPDLRTSAVGTVKFTYWDVNGVRQTDPGGYSRSVVTFPVNAPSVATAHYFDSSFDDDFDDILDWYELAHFGTLNRNGSNDGDGDGLTLAGEVFRGYSPLVRDVVAPGGISRRRSQTLGVNTVQLSVPPYVTANGPTDVTATSARLNAVVNAAGLPATVYFEHGPTTAYGTTTTVQPVGGTSGSIAVAELVTGLEPATVYHFRVVAQNSKGVTTTADVTFSTLWNATTAEGFEDAGVANRWQTTGGVWAVGPQAAFSGLAGAGTPPGGNYPANSDSRFVSPLFEVPAAENFPRLRFDHRWQFGTGDHGAIEIREGTTGIWQTAATFVGQAPDWSDKSLDLTAYAGRRIQVAFRIRSDNDASTGTGWLLDNVGLVTGGVAGWLADTPDGFVPENFWRDWTAAGQAWDCGVPTSGPGGAFEGSTCAATNLGGDYPANFDGRLISPFFQVPSAHLNPRLRFWHWFHFGSGDRGTIEVRRPGGPWQALDTFTGAGGSAWSKPSISLAASAGQWVQVAFRMVSDAADQRPGWYLDAAEIVTGADVLNNPETFDKDIGDWRTDANGIWQIGRPTSGPGSAHGGNNVAATNLSGNYPANSVARLESPAFPVGDPGANRLITLRFWQWYQFGAGDQGSLGISVRDGEIWSDWVSVLTASASSGGWQQRVLDLGSYRGKTIKLGFLHSADGDAATGPGWYIDDLEITSVVRGELTPGIPVRNDISASGDFQYYVLNLDTAGPLMLSLANDGAGNRIEIFTSRGLLPSRGANEYGNASGPGANRDVLIPWASAGTWYVLVYADTVVTPGSFTLQAVSRSVALTGSTPASHASNVAMTMTLSGAGFRPGTKVEMIPDSGIAVAAGTVAIDSFTGLTATFPANSLPPGTYDIKVSQAGGGSATLPDAFESLAAGAPNLETKLIMPGAIRPGAPATIYIEYANTGNASMAAPLLQLKPRDGGNRPILTLNPALTVQTFWAGDSNLPPGASSEIFILASGAQAGVLHPGERMQVPVYYSSLLQPWTGASLDMEIRYWTADDSSPVNWLPLKAQLRPPTLDAAVWEIVFANLTSGLATTADYVRMLNENASFLGRLGQRIIDVGELWNFELQQAYGYSPLPVIDTATDAAVASPGNSLSIGRRYSSNLRSRWETGPFGRGWYTPWQTRLLVENGGAIVRIVGEGGSARVFSRDTRNGSYFSGAGDSSKLGAIGGGYELREPNGTVTRFNSSGRIVVVDDANGNRITASYSSDRLSALTHGSGESITVSYGGSGFVSGLTDSTGRSTTFTYNGSYLASATTDDGKSTTYTYQTTGIPARLHALTSVTRAGVTRAYAWDDRGRLTSTSLTGGVQALAFGYDEAGGVTLSDSGGSSAFFFDHHGLLAKTVDPLGNITTSEFDKDLRLRRLLLPSGDSRSFTWCSCGSPATITDELGHTTRFSYDHPLKKMTAFVDAKGNRTSYSYDAKGNLLATTYADQSVESLGSFNSSGLPATLTNRRNQTSTFTYTAAGQIATRTLADGSSAGFEYDTRGNLVQVTEHPVSGPDKVTTYNFTPATTGDRLRKVNYPNGGWVEYFYDTHGRRNRMTDSAGGDTRYDYDSVGRLWKLRDGNDVQLVEYLYDNAGRLLRINKGNGTYTTYQYDAASQILLLVNHAPGGTPNSSFGYTYDARGRRTRMATLDGVWTYAYDATGQLVRAVLASTNPAIADQDLRYNYDALGNRTSTVINGVTTAYVANNLNQYTSVGGMSHQYDADGNLVSDGERTYVYNAEGRVILATGPEGARQHEYDAFGNRIATAMNGERVDYLLDPTGLVNVIAGRTSPSAGTSRFMHGLGLVFNETQGSPAYFDYDAIGSTVGVSGQGGLGGGNASYLPFGEPLFSSLNASIEARFVGQFGVSARHNEPTYMRARFYLPRLGMFTSPDPLQLDSGDYNFYRYVSNDPIGSIDPTGLVSASIDIGRNIPEDRRYVDGLDLRHAAAGCRLGQMGGKYFGRILANVLGFGVEVVQLGADPESAFKKEDFRSNDAGGKYGAAGGNCNNLIPPPVGPPFIPPGSGTSGGSGGTPIIISRDPNEKIGPGGYGPANWVRAGDAFPYRINFENLGPGSKDANGNPYPTYATAPAQRVTITDQLAPQFDWTTFRLTEIGFGDTVVPVPGGSSHYAGSVRVVQGDKAFEVAIEAGINFNTGLVTIELQSLDPDSGLPPEATLGLLPPEDGTRRGMGHVSYLVRTKSDLPDGVTVRNVAQIRFDTNEIIATNQIDPQNAAAGTDPAKEALVTVDSSAPSGSVHPLPGLVKTEFEVSWGGDDGSASGVANYTVYVSDDGGLTWSVWLADTTLTHAVFTGTAGKSYRFHVVVKDRVGNVQVVDPASASVGTTAVGSSMIEVRQASGTPLVPGSGKVDFGTVKLGLAASRDLTILNVGPLPLKNLAVQVMGNHAADFTLTAPATNTLGVGSSTTFTVNFAPRSGGVRGSLLRVTSNDPHVPSYDVYLAGTGSGNPEIWITADGKTGLVDGSGSLDFGKIVAGAKSALKTFTIRNTGNGSLGGLKIVPTGKNAADFLVGPLGADTVAPGGGTTFTVVFNPAAVGARAAVLQVVSNDADESPFDIGVKGTGLVAPKIAVTEGKGNKLKDGKSIVNFGKPSAGAGGVVRTITITNSGKAKLGKISLAIDGKHASDFAITPLKAKSLAPGKSAKVNITFKPKGKGNRNAMVHIKSNDPRIPSFDFVVKGTGKKTTKKSSSVVASSEDPEISGDVNDRMRVTAGTTRLAGRRFRIIDIRRPNGGEPKHEDVQVSPNLLDWFSGPKHTTVVEETAGRLKVRDNTPLDEGKKRFIRVKPRK